MEVVVAGTSTLARRTIKEVDFRSLTGAEDFGPYWALAIVLVVTWILTELMSNNAAAGLKGVRS
ncbi:MAG: hypothetical protein Q8M01_02855 [Rubrivivax sp.]|nr:hypothetical protein [Rubrivivax sp.]